MSDEAKAGELDDLKKNVDRVAGRSTNSAPIGTGSIGSNAVRPTSATVRCWRCKHEVPEETTVCNAGVGTQCKDAKACRGRWYGEHPRSSDAQDRAPACEECQAMPAQATYFCKGCKAKVNAAWKRSTDYAPLVDRIAAMHREEPTSAGDRGWNAALSDVRMVIDRLSEQKRSDCT